ncbi:hypothetical protein PYCCODRAFT_602836 [Trametes coccinea BRFM310]|uniref:PIN domain-like protein n=1 Tax=Trametes coccinea (strain BRFM310) TaxID=1353009 RepID=A0A1Y2J1T6_TRAC3|nr:hypothetical protein PYCCODRAFT_602836 [Trametes coccinea BRFM310]
MGIEGLWKLVEGATERHSLKTLAVREGFEGPRSSRLYTVGVDVSIWMRQLQQTFAAGHAQSGENPELRTFFYRLAMLAERPLHIIFVNDGPSKPAIKRGKRVKLAPHWLTEGMRRYVDAFGFAWFDVKAEAELARMNELGVIDAVMTDDSDVLLFGAPAVMRNPSFKRSAADEIELTRASAVRDLGYTRGDLLLYALLVGSDYDQVGLPRCGLRTATGVIKYGIGRTLLAALLASTASEFATFAVGWRARLQQVVRTDPAGLVGRTSPSLAANIPATFPDYDIAKLLACPAVSDPAHYQAIRAPTSLDLARIGELCELYFSWGNHPEIIKTLRTSLWPGECLRMLINEGLERQGVEISLRRLLNVAVLSVSEPPGSGYAHCRVQVSDCGFNAEVARSLRHLRPYRSTARTDETTALTEGSKPLILRLPAVVFERARPCSVNPTYDLDAYLYGRPDRSLSLFDKGKRPSTSGMTQSSTASTMVPSGAEGTYVERYVNMLGHRAEDPSVLDRSFECRAEYQVVLGHQSEDATTLGCCAEDAGPLGRRAEDTAALGRRAEDAAALGRRAEETTALGRRDVAVLGRREGDAAALGRRAEDTTALGRRAEDPTALRRRAEDATALGRRAEDVAVLRRRAEDATALGRRAEDAAALGRRAEDAAALRCRAEDATATAPSRRVTHLSSNSMQEISMIDLTRSPSPVARWTDVLDISNASPSSSDIIDLTADVSDYEDNVCIDLTTDQD